MSFKPLFRTLLRRFRQSQATQDQDCAQGSR